MASTAFTETIPVPVSVRFPVELEPPAGFRPEEPASWPQVEGRLEWVGGRLLYMPPCGDTQQLVAASVVALLVAWVEEHPAFVAGGNEAGMLLGGDVRGAEGTVFRRADLGKLTGGYIRLPAILAVEVAGREEREPELRAKSAWYLGHGVEVLWLVLPRTREVIVVRRDAESRHRVGESLPVHTALPGLAPPVERFFRQLD